MADKEHEWTTASGIPLKKIYGPEDIKNLDYEKDLGQPGKPPFTRGAYPDMYRRHMWTTRMLTGLSTPQETNERLKMLLKEGQTGLNVVGDRISQCRIDADHPGVRDLVGQEGCPNCSMADMETILEGLPLDKIGVNLNFVHVDGPTYVVLAQKRGYDISKLSGTFGGNVAYLRLGWPDAWEFHWPKDSEGRFSSNYKLNLDWAEFALKNMPRWNLTGASVTYVREVAPAPAALEIAICITAAKWEIGLLLQRGLDIDEIAPRYSVAFGGYTELFEEVAKLRAARRIWARMMKDDYKAKDPKSMRMRMHVQTGGSTMQRQQPLVNLSRTTIQALAAILGGTQSLHICSYDEAFRMPSDEAAILALRCQQVIAHETDVHKVIDPLGGSYYVESLTDKVEEDIYSYIKEIEDQGGFFEAVANGWIPGELDKFLFESEDKMKSKEKIIVGRNEYVVPEEESKGEVAVQEIDRTRVDEYIAGVKQLKASRDNTRVKESLKNLRHAAEQRTENLLPHAVEAIKAYATVQEIFGVLRMVDGFDYDLLGELEYPF